MICCPHAPAIGTSSAGRGMQGADCSSGPTLALALCYHCPKILDAAPCPPIAPSHLPRQAPCPTYMDLAPSGECVHGLGPAVAAGMMAAATRKTWDLGVMTVQAWGQSQDLVPACPCPWNCCPVQGHVGTRSQLCLGPALSPPHDPAP